MTRILVWGAGQHGAVVAELAELCGHTVAGFVDRQPGSAQVISEEVARNQLAAGVIPLGADRVLFAIGDNSVRSSLAAEFSELLPDALIHPQAFVSPSASVGPGTVVLPSAVVQTRATIGRAVIVHVGAIVDHHASIEDGTYLAPGCVVCGGAVVECGVQVSAGQVVGKGVRLSRMGASQG